MQNIIKRVSIVAAVVATIVPTFVRAQSSSAPTPERLNVVFVVDTSGSMEWSADLSEAEKKRVAPDYAAGLAAYKEVSARVLSGLDNFALERIVACYAGCRFKKLNTTSTREAPAVYSGDPLWLAHKEWYDAQYEIRDGANKNNVRKIDAAKRAVLGLVNSLEAVKNRLDTYLSLVSFDNDGWIRFEPTQDFTQARIRINGLSAFWGTNLSSGLEEAFKAITPRESALTNERNPIPGKTVMMVLTDGRNTGGLDRDDVVEKYVALARERNVVINTVGFGIVEEEVDRDLLERLAKGTGGTYRFNTTSNALATSFLRGAHEAVGNTVVSEEQGTINQGEEKPVGSFDVDYSVRDLLITVGWPGSSLQVYLVDAKGNRVPETAYALKKEGNVITVQMKDPPTGRYQIVAVGEDVPEGTTDYNVVVSEKIGSFRALDLLKDYWPYEAGSLIIIVAVILILKRKK